MVELEEEVGRSPDHTAKKEAHTYHPFVILCPWRASRVVHNPPRVVDIVVSRPQSPQTGCSILIGSSQRLRHYMPPISYRLYCWRVRTPNFYRVTRRFCLHPQIQIEIWVGRRIVPVSLPQSAIICLLKIKKKIIIFNSRK